MAAPPNIKQAQIANPDRKRMATSARIIVGGPLRFKA